jgi:NADPH-dependent 2,4-dienoyl-CoA reductase/sulfur reductase-like enzyme
VTAEPYIGHLGVGGVGDTKGVLESEMRQRHIKWIVNAKVDKVDTDKMHVTEVDDDGKPKKAHELAFKFSMMIPAFRGIAAVRGIEGLANPRGFIVVDKHQRNPKYRNVFGVGVCIAIAPLEQTPLPVGVPKTGYMIESMVTATALNIGQLVSRRGGNPRGYLERHLSCRFRRFRRRLCRFAAKSAAQRQLGVERPLGSCGQGGVREILPAQSARRHDGALLRKDGDAAS